MTASLVQFEPRRVFEMVLAINYPEPLDKAKFLESEAEWCNQLIVPLFSLKEEHLTAEKIKNEFSQAPIKKQELARLGSVYDQYPLFDASIGIYTMEEFYGFINNTFAKRNFYGLANYLASILLFLPQKQQYAFKEQNELYRGVKKGRINPDHYKVGKRYYFHAFTSTSLSLPKAQNFAKQGGTIFKIIVGKNFPMHNLKVFEIGSFFKDELEVLLMPNFYFQVMRKYKLKGQRYIQLQEVSHANLLDMGRLACTKVVWVDKFINSEQNLRYKEKLLKNFPSLVTYNKFNTALANIQRPASCILIVSGSEGKDRIRKIATIRSVHSVIVYCINVEHHKQWAKDYDVVKGVVITFSELEQLIRQSFEVFLK